MLKEDVQTTWHVFWTVELLSLGIIMLCCMLTRSLYETCVCAQYQAQDAHASVHKLLSVLCDAVVHLGPSGRIIGKTPHFNALLCASPDQNLDDTLFASHLRNQSDRTRFEDMIRSASGDGAPAAALPVHMNRDSGGALLVELFFVHLPTLHGQSGHVISLSRLGL